MERSISCPNVDWCAYYPCLFSGNTTLPFGTHICNTTVCFMLLSVQMCVCVCVCDMIIRKLPASRLLISFTVSIDLCTALLLLCNDCLSNFCLWLSTSKHLAHIHNAHFPLSLSPSGNWSKDFFFFDNFVFQFCF